MAREEVPEKLKDVKMTGRKTHEQMHNIRIAQVGGDVEMIDANMADDIKDRYFRDEYAGYQIPAHDADAFVVAMEARLFNQQTGEKISKSKIQIFDPLTFKRLLDQNGFHGHTVVILHDPTANNEQLRQSFAPVARHVDQTGKVKTTEAGKQEQTSTPPGASSTLTPPYNPAANREGGDPRVGDDQNGGETHDEDDLGDTSGSEQQQEHVNVDELKTDAQAKKAYTKLTGKHADGRWSLDRIKQEISEIQGDVK